jgi:hypothetical protein
LNSAVPEAARTPIGMERRFTAAFIFQVFDTIK